MQMSVIALFYLVPIAAGGDGWDSKGEIVLETRAFSDDDQDFSQDVGLGLFSRLEASYKKGAWRLRMRGFARIDRKDSDRDLTAFEEAFVGYRKSGWEARLGFQMLNWTATEAFHPADVVNSRNLDSAIENPEKLGELMFSLRRRMGQGGLTFYYLPRYEEPKLPGPHSRLGFVPPGFQITPPVWIESDGRISENNAGTQWGLRFNQTLGDGDLSLFYLDHMDRQQPAVTIDLTTPSPSVSPSRLTPYYFRVKDLGVTYQHVLGDWIFKLEAAHKDFIEVATGPAVEDHTQVAFGIDYGWSATDGSETTLLLEGSAVLGTNEQQRALLSSFQRDLLLGYRRAFNDIMSRSVLVTVIVDMERSHELLANLEYEQRLSDTWRVKAGLRWIDAPQKEDLPVGLERLDEANQAYLNLSRFF